MTLIGAFEMSDVVLFADSQETISDYAKWNVNKIGHFEFEQQVRFLMSGAGDANMIDMVWEQVTEAARKLAWDNPSKINAAGMKELILRTVNSITRKCILPYPRQDRPWVDLIWVVQQLAPLPPEAGGITWGIDVFHTHGLTVNTIRSKYFTGNPLLLMQYLSDLYVDGLIIGTEEAEALAVYLLWEAKEYDPTCGKHSHIVTIKRDGGIRRMTFDEVLYWEDHFAHLKHSLKLLPLLSCSGRITDQHIYDPKEHLQRFLTSFRTLNREQKRMRTRTKDLRTELEKKLVKNLRRTAAKFAKPSVPQKLKDQQ